MKLPFELFVARRYLRARQRTGFINIITYISIIGVTIGVAALIIVLSVMNGFESEVRSRIIGVDTHVRVRRYHAEPLENHEEIIPVIKQNIEGLVGVSPFVEGKAMLKVRGGAGYQSGILLRGVDAETVGDVSDLKKNIVHGSFELGHFPCADGDSLPGIILGKYLADRLGGLTMGSEVFAISLAGVTTTYSVPYVKKFVVTGIF